jgi:outer membrane protein TolC
MSSILVNVRCTGRLVGAGPWRMLVVLSVGAFAGCAAQDSSRTIETTYARAQGATDEPVAPPPSVSKLPGSAASFRGGNHPAPSALASAPPLRISRPTRATILAAVEPPWPAASIASRSNRDTLVKPVTNEATIPAPSALVMPLPAATYPIDLATALRLADVSNPTIGAARTLILEALALQLTARTLLLPSLNSGVTYRGHDGVLQRVSGKMIDPSLQQLFVGSGVGPFGSSGTATLPGVNLFCQLTDAWFEPLAARQRVAGARFGAQATSFDILLDVALLHLELLGNQSILDFQRLSESQFHQVYQLAKDYAEAGEGRESDAHRALSQWKRRIALVQKAEEDVAVTAARLANRLNLDPAVRLEPIGGPLVPLSLVPITTPQQDLIQLALRQRPDIAARTAVIGEAEAHKKQEIGRPLLPTLWLGFSGGVFGGGSNLVPPLVGNFASRTDFDVRVYWTLLNLGAGNLALIKERDAQIGQAIAERSRTINRARDEVSAALAEARAAQNEIDVAQGELASAELSYKEDLERTRFRGSNKPRDVLPIEILNSLDLLASARVNLIHALVHYDQSQYRLWVSMGSPPPLSRN